MAMMHLLPNLVEISSCSPEKLTFFEIQYSNATIFSFHDKWIWHVPLWRLSASRAVLQICAETVQQALTHPSFRMNYGTNADHARNSLTNCGKRQLEYGDKRIHYIHTRKRGKSFVAIIRLKEVHIFSCIAARIQWSL